jgi:hypothetical protein
MDDGISPHLALRKEGRIRSDDTKVYDSEYRGNAESPKSRDNRRRLVGEE